jgi:hypothetical protein
VWSGKINFESGGHLVAVEYDSDDTAAVLRDRCADWLSSDTRDIPAPFGVRVAQVGMRRRRVGVVHHGAPVRHRLDNVDAAAGAIARFLDEISCTRPENLVAIEARVFARGDRVVLLDIPLSTDVDERPLRRLDIAEVLTYRPLLDPSTAGLTIGAEAYAISGIVVQRPEVQSLDDARRRIWSLGEGPRLPWAEFVDQFGDRIIWDGSDLATTLDRALRLRLR